MGKPRKEDISFMALGGGQSVGASCYFLQLGGQNILLDCGTGMKDGLIFAPDFRAPLETGIIDSLGEIPRIFISHAHMDHIGALPMFLKETSHAVVYMTELTRFLAEAQLSRPRKASCGNDNWLSQIATVSYLSSFDFLGYKVSFLPAGHIPGAMMTLFNFRGRNILYTGDYSVHASALTSGCSLPQEQVDILLMCGLHAHHSDTCRGGGQLSGLLSRMRRIFSAGRPISCRVHQLSKGVEFLTIFNRAFPDIPIYVDSGIMRIVDQFERVGIPIMKENIHHWTGGFIREPVHILTAAGEAREQPDGYVRIDTDFSLHDDFEDTAAFVKKINPRVCVVVHSPFGRNGEEGALELRLLHDAECRTQVIYAEQGEFYSLL